MNEKEYRQYRLLRNTMTFTLQQLWPSMKDKLYELTDDVGNTDLGIDEALHIKSIIDDFQEKCIDEIVQYRWPSEKEFNLEYEKNLKEEAKLVKTVIANMYDIYSEFFNSFIGNVTFESSRNSYDGLPDSIKFRDYNIDLRHPVNGKINLKKCNANNASDLLKKNEHRMELMQGYWQSDSLIREMRNQNEHFIRDGKNYLKKTFHRQMADPISQAETTANVFTLCSSLILVSHHFAEILQTWIDTSKLIKK